MTNQLLGDDLDIQIKICEIITGKKYVVFELLSKYLI